MQPPPDTTAAAEFSRSDIQILRERSALPDEAEAGLGLGAQEGVHRLSDCAVVAVAQLNAKQRAPPRVHGRFFELLRVHLAETLEAADLDLAATIENRAQQLFLVLIVARVRRDVALRDLVERRHGQIEMSVLDELRHLLIEEGDE